MQIRFTSAVGLPVTTDDAPEALAVISGLLLHPDTGKVEGFFVRARGMLGMEDLFLSSADVAHWGTRLSVRHADVLAPLEDHVRLKNLAEEGRPILGQRIVTEEEVPLGRCRDVQFATQDCRLQWLFPKGFFRWGTPIPASQILRVTRDAIIVRSPAAPAQEEEVTAVLPPLPEVA